MEEQYPFHMPFFTPFGYGEDRPNIRYSPPTNENPWEGANVAPPSNSIGNPFKDGINTGSYKYASMPNNPRSNMLGQIGNLASSMGFDPMQMANKAAPAIGKVASGMTGLKALGGSASGAMGALGLNPVTAGIGLYTKLVGKAMENDPKAPSSYMQQSNKFADGGMQPIDFMLNDMNEPNPYDYNTNYSDDFVGPHIRPTENTESLSQLSFSPSSNSTPDLFKVLPKAPNTANFSKASTSDREARTIQFFMEKGIPAHVAKGIAANVKFESNYDVNNVGDRGKARGLFQWHPDRRSKLAKFDLTSFEGNLEAAYHEMTKGQEKNNFAKVMKAKTSSEAAYLFDTHYERSDHKTRNARAEYAKQLDRLYVN